MSIHKYQSLKGTTYFVKIYLGLNDYGKKKYYTKRGFKTRKAAKAHEAAITHQLNSGVFVQLSRQASLTYKELIKSGTKPIKILWKQPQLRKLLTYINFIFYQSLGRKKFQKLVPWIAKPLLQIRPSHSRI